jgi:hypothetical protein
MRTLPAGPPQQETCPRAACALHDPDVDHLVPLGSFGPLRRRHGSASDRCTPGSARAALETAGGRAGAGPGPHGRALCRRLPWSDEVPSPRGIRHLHPVRNSFHRPRGVGISATLLELFPGCRPSLRSRQGCTARVPKRDNFEPTGSTSARSLGYRCRYALSAPFLRLDAPRAPWRARSSRCPRTRRRR